MSIIIIQYHLCNKVVYKVLKIQECSPHSTPSSHSRRNKSKLSPSYCNSYSIRKYTDLGIYFLPSSNKIKITCIHQFFFKLYILSNPYFVHFYEGRKKLNYIFQSLATFISSIFFL